MDPNEFEYVLKLKKKVWERYKPNVALREWSAKDRKGMAIDIETETNCFIHDRTLKRFDKLDKDGAIDTSDTVQILAMYVLGKKHIDVSKPIPPIYFTQFIRSLYPNQSIPSQPNSVPLPFREAIISYTLYIKSNQIIYPEKITIFYKEGKVVLESSFFKMTFEGSYKINSGYLYIETWGKEKFKGDKRLDIWIYKGRNTIIQELDILEGVIMSSKKTGFPIYGEILLIKNECIEPLSENDLNKLKGNLKVLHYKKSFGEFDIPNLNYLD